MSILLKKGFFFCLSEFGGGGSKHSSFMVFHPKSAVLNVLSSPRWCPHCGLTTPPETFADEHTMTPPPA